MPWLLLLQTHSAFDAGLISAMRYIPLVALGLFAGMAADSVNRRLLMVLCDLGRAIALGMVVLLAALGQTSPLWLLALVVLVLGIGQLGFQVAYRAWVPDVTGDEQLSHANAALEASDAISTLAGPSLGGLLIQAFGPALALGSDALSYIISALTLLFVGDEKSTTFHRSEQQPSIRSLWAEVLGGVHLILTSPTQRLLQGVGTTIYISSGAIELLLAMLTQVRLHLPAWQAGLVFGAAGIGGLVGSVLAPRLYSQGWRRGLAWTLSIAALASAGLALSSMMSTEWGFITALIANFVLDGAVSLSFILTGTANTLVTPRELRGRVSAANTIYTSLIRGIAVLAVGVLAINSNPLPMFILLIVCFIAAALICGSNK